MAVFCASGTHVPKRTLRAGSRKPPFSPRPNLNLNTPQGEFATPKKGHFTGIIRWAYGVFAHMT